MTERTGIVAVVDDDPSILNAMDALLSAHGYGCELYRSARAFLTDIVASAASCAVIDINLGEDDGVALVHQLRKSGFTIPVIFVTASDDEAVRRRALEAGCVGFFRKPFVPDSLVAAIAKARRHFN